MKHSHSATFVLALSDVKRNNTHCELILQSHENTEHSSEFPGLQTKWSQNFPGLYILTPNKILKPPIYREYNQV